MSYDLATAYVRSAATLASVEAVLGWDERCMLPPGGGDHRAEQMTLLAGMVHEQLTDPRLGACLDELADGPLTKDPHSDTGATIRQLKHHYDRRVKLPKSLVEELARTSVRGQQAWQEARSKNDFAAFRPHLEQMLSLKRQQAAALGYAERPYDALVDEFEQGERASNLSKVLGHLRDGLVPLVARIAEAKRRPDVSILHRSYPAEAQAAFGQQAAAAIGFDFERGRLDVTAHPFCATLGPGDTRLTTRYDPQFFNSGFFGILHEAGHGIYEQGLPKQHFGLPLGETVSLGIHESQSRLWENFVGRSLPFWKHFYPQAQQAYPAALKDVKLADFHFAVNDVRPSLIRVEADEATYNLHILIRFELEQALVHDELKVVDLPAAWSDAYTRALGITPPDDARGCLQDIHWSAGLIGYFPTYSLGNLYAAQFFAQADRDLGGIDDLMAAGKFEPLHHWLGENIHRHGQRYAAAELVQRITGRPLSSEALIAHLTNKLAPLYGL